jgi:hypothetical protein
MSLLNAGGKRDTGGSARVFGAEQIRRVCIQRLKGRDHERIARTSIALGNRNIRRISSPHDCAPHEHKREIARRRRQAEARAA